MNVLFLLILLTACERHIAVPDDAPAAPEWLREKIAGMEHEKYYAGASVVRHEWKSKYYYYINIPPSSCMYCEVYDAVGNRVDWTQEDLWDYVAHRTNEVLIYKRGMR